MKITKRQLNFIIENTIKDVLNEIKITDAYKRFYSDIKEEDYNKIVAADTVTSNPEKNFLGPYAKWLLKIYQQGNLKIEDVYKAKESLHLFDKLCKSNKIQIKDINKYRSLQDIFQTIEPFENKEGDIVSKGDEIRKIKNDGSETVYEDQNWLCKHIKTEEAAIYYGKNTKWCTAATTDENMFNSYNKNGPIYFIINKKTNKKYQYHRDSKQFMDELDKPITLPPDTFPQELLKCIGIKIITKPKILYDDNDVSMIYSGNDKKWWVDEIKIIDKKNKKEYEYNNGYFEDTTGYDEFYSIMTMIQSFPKIPKHLFLPLIEFNKLGYSIQYIDLDTKGIINKNFEWIVDPIFIEIDVEDKIIRLINKYKQTIVLDKKTLKIKDQFNVETMEIEKDGLRIAMDNVEKKMGLMNRNFEWVVKPKYDYIEYADEDGNRMVKINNCCGIINQELKEVVKPKYSYIGNLKKDGFRIVAISRDKKGLIDKNFEPVLDTIYDNIYRDEERNNDIIISQYILSDRCYRSGTFNKNTHQIEWKDGTVTNPNNNQMQENHILNNIMNNIVNDIIMELKNQKFLIEQNKKILTENAESRNIEKSMELVIKKFNCDKKKAQEIVTVNVVGLVPNARTLYKAKYLPGITRMFLDNQIDMMNSKKLDKTLKYLEGHTDYNNDLNGMSADQLIEQFSELQKQDDKQEKEKREKTIYINKSTDGTYNGYLIKQIKDGKQAAQYADHVGWCICRGAYDTYTNNKTGIFYFIINPDFEYITREDGDEEYAKSMIAVCVDIFGDMTRCTSRFNNTDKFMDENEISHLIGMQFEKAFPPRPKEEILKNMKFENDGLSIQQKGEYFGLMNQNFEWEPDFEPKYSEISKANRFNVRKVEIYDKKELKYGRWSKERGWLLKPIYKDIVDDFEYENYNSKYIIIRSMNDKCGLVTRNYKPIKGMEPKYKFIEFEDIDEGGYIIAGLNNKEILIDKNFNVVEKTGLNYDSISMPNTNGERIVSANGKFGVIDKNLNLIIDTIFDEINDKEIDENGCRVVKLNNKYGIINQTGEWMPNCKPIYDDIYSEDEYGCRIVRNENQYGLIDEKYNLVLDTIYDNIWKPFKNGTRAAVLKNIIRIVSRKFKVIEDLKADDIQYNKNTLIGFDVDDNLKKKLSFIYDINTCEINYL